MRRIEYGGNEYLIHTRSGMRLLETMQEFGIPVACDCKGAESSGKCTVKFERPVLFLLNNPTALERQVLGEKIEQGFRLACQALYR